MGLAGRVDLDRVRERLAVARRITVLSGAGVSTDSGIPDFRGPQGTWTLNPADQRLATLSAYLDDPEVRAESWRRRLDHPAWSARPNAAHRALVDLERDGRLQALLTQNIDELHQRAGSDPALVVELHGTVFGTECLRCGERGRMVDALDRVRAGETDPPCPTCGGIIKSATISFGQELDAAVLERARVAAESCEVLLAVGSSLTVHPAAGLVGVAARQGADVVIVNAEPTPYDAVAWAVLRGRLAEVLPDLVGAG
jgi:NAD-dependent deacetylase